MTNCNVSTENMEWIYQFAKLHNITNFDDALSKLIDIHKTWNKKI